MLFCSILGPGDMASRTKGVDLVQKNCWELLSKHVPLGKCSPTDLWKVRSIQTSGMTSDWTAIRASMSFISDILDATAGKTLNQKRMARQLDGWLRERGMEWQFLDVERAVKRLRAMFSTLLAVRRGDKTIPKTHKLLEAIVAKMELIIPTPSPSKASDDHDDDDEDGDDDNAEVPENAPAAAVGGNIIVQVQEANSDDDLDQCMKSLFKKQAFNTPALRPSATTDPAFMQISRKQSTFTLFSMPSESSSLLGADAVLRKHAAATAPNASEYRALSKTRSKRVRGKQPDIGTDSDKDKGMGKGKGKKNKGKNTDKKPDGKKSKGKNTEKGTDGKKSKGKNKEKGTDGQDNEEEKKKKKVKKKKVLGKKRKTLKKKKKKKVKKPIKKEAGASPVGGGDGGADDPADIVAKYINCKDDEAIVQKRVHSAAYHRENNFLKTNSAVDEAERRQRAQAAGKLAVRKWREAKGLPNL